KEKDNSTVKRLSRYSLGYLDFSDHHEGRVEKTLWYKLMVKHNNIITEKRPPSPPPTPPPPCRLRPFMRYAQDLTSSDNEEEFDKLFEWAWPSAISRMYAEQSTTGTRFFPSTVPAASIHMYNALYLTCVVFSSYLISLKVLFCYTCHHDYTSIK
ncbi:hypothetical protein Tco_0283889, partial [Tanacetum coccineum]